MNWYFLFWLFRWSPARLPAMLQQVPVPSRLLARLEQVTLLRVLSQLQGHGQLLMLVLGPLQALLHGQQRLVLGLSQARGRLGNLHSGARTLSTGV